jgi:hypothetical protein
MTYLLLCTTPDYGPGRFNTFYTTKLGLTLEFQYQDFYAGIPAGDQLFHLKLVDERDSSIEFVDKGNTSTSTS